MSFVESNALNKSKIDKYFQSDTQVDQSNKHDDNFIKMKKEAAAKVWIRILVCPVAYSGKLLFQILQDTFKLSYFNQLECIIYLVSGKDCFLIAPTGSGKSAIYQIAGLMKEEGVTVVISPLKSLSIDQVHSLHHLKVTFLC